MGLNWEEGFKGLAGGLKLIADRQMRREENETEALRRENLERLQNQLAGEREAARDERVAARQEKHDIAMADRAEKTQLAVTERSHTLLAERERAADERFYAQQERLDETRDINIGEDAYQQAAMDRDRAVSDLEKARSELQTIRKAKAEELGLDPNSDASIIKMAESDELVRSHLYAMRDADRRKREAEEIMRRKRPLQGSGTPPRRGGTRNPAPRTPGPASRNRARSSLIPQERPRLIDMGE